MTMAGQAQHFKTCMPSMSEGKIIRKWEEVIGRGKGRREGKSGLPIPLE